MQEYLEDDFEASNQKMDEQQVGSQNLCKTNSTNRHSPSISVQDLEHITDIILDNFLDHLTSNQDPPFDEVIIRQLTVWLDQNSWRPYGQKTQSREVKERPTLKYLW